MRFDTLLVGFSLIAGLTAFGSGCNSTTDVDPSGTTSSSGGGGMVGVGGNSAEGGGGVGGTPEACPTIAPALSAIAADAFPDDQRGGIVVGVASPSCSGWVEGTGGLEPVPAEGIVKYSSASRLLVSAAVLSLVDDGLLSLSDTLDQWRPDVPNAAAITLRMLLNHTTGLSNHFTHPNMQSALAANPRRIFDPDELIDYTAELEATTPGESFDTQFINYIILGVIIEEVTGKPAHEAIRERVIAPLGLESVGLLVAEVDEEAVEPGYQQGGKEVGMALHPSAWWVTASYAGTTADMVRLLRGLYGTDTVLSAASRAALTDMPAATGEAQFESGLGVFIDSSRPHDLIGQAGTIPGYEVRAFYVPELDAGIAIMATNSEAATLAPLYDVYGVLAQPR